MYVNTWDWNGYSSDFTVSGSATIPLPGGGSVNVGGGESTDQYRYNPYGTYGNYPYYNQGAAGIGLGTVLILGLLAFLLLKS